MQIIPITDPQAISLAVAALGRGELVIYPTETCYGIAADCCKPLAVSRLLSYKGDRHRQVAIAVSSRNMATKYVELGELAENLYTRFLPGPITVISSSLNSVDPRLESSTGTLGVRIPNYPFTLDLIQSFGVPVTATSANTSGKKEPYSLADWQKYTTKGKQAMVALFLDAGRLADRPTSTVIDTTLNDPQILRQGQITLPDLAHTLTSYSPQDTQKIAGNIISKHLPLTRRFPLIIALQGELGAGKTQFVKGLAMALGIDVNVSSPTYTIMKEYPYAIYGSELSAVRNEVKDSSEPLVPKYSGVLYHLDTWRLPDSRELESTLHLSKLLKPGSLVAIEWAGKAQELLKSYEKDIPILVIDIKEKNVNTRQITYAFTTPEWS